LTPLIAKYRDDAIQIYFPYPRALTGNPKGDTFMRMLVIAFNRDGLARAAAKRRTLGRLSRCPGEELKWQRASLRENLCNCLPEIDQRRLILGCDVARKSGACRSF
jgi:hypothetical protein